MRPQCSKSQRVLVQSQGHHLHPSPRDSHLQHCTASCRLTRRSCPAKVHSGDLAVSGEWESGWRRSWLQLKGAQESMSIVWRLQPVYFNSMKRSLMAANELMQTPARGWAFCNSLPSLLPAIYSKPKPDLITSTAERANPFA